MRVLEAYTAGGVVELTIHRTSVISKHSNVGNATNKVI